MATTKNIFQSQQHEWAFNLYSNSMTIEHIIVWLFRYHFHLKRLHDDDSSTFVQINQAESCEIKQIGYRARKKFCTNYNWISDVRDSRYRSSRWLQVIKAVKQRRFDVNFMKLLQIIPVDLDSLIISVSVSASGWHGFVTKNQTTLRYEILSNPNYCNNDKKLCECEWISRQKKLIWNIKLLEAYLF